jgi:membrane-bound metal-dependent hydrolase YbcI (DUF457 family)
MNTIKKDLIAEGYALLAALLVVIVLLCMLGTNVFCECGIFQLIVMDTAMDISIHDQSIGHAVANAAVWFLVIYFLISLIRQIKLYFKHTLTNLLMMCAAVLLMYQFYQYIQLFERMTSELNFAATEMRGGVGILWIGMGLLGAVNVFILAFTTYQRYKQKRQA